MNESYDLIFMYKFANRDTETWGSKSPTTAHTFKQDHGVLWPKRRSIFNLLSMKERVERWMLRPIHMLNAEGVNKTVCQ